MLTETPPLALATREPLPDRRRQVTTKAVVGGQTLYLCIGHYADGRPGEIFIDVSRAGSALRGVMGTLARLASMALQHRLPLATVVAALRGQRFEPSGAVTGSPEVTEADSLVDFIAKQLEA